MKGSAGRSGVPCGMWWLWWPGDCRIVAKFQDHLWGPSHTQHPHPSCGFHGTIFKDVKHKDALPLTLHRSAFNFLPPAQTQVNIFQRSLLCDNNWLVMALKPGILEPERDKLQYLHISSISRDYDILAPMLIVSVLLNPVDSFSQAFSPFSPVPAWCVTWACLSWAFP